MTLIKFTALIKDGGSESLQIDPKMFAQLTLNIQENGSETIQLKDRSLVIVGIIKTSKEAGKRIIICNDPIEGDTDNGQAERKD
jgi:hypothetical protein